VSSVVDFLVGGKGKLGKLQILAEIPIVSVPNLRYHTRAVQFSMPSQLQSRGEIVKIGKMLHQRGFIAACDGNLSVRLNREKILVTPTAMSKGVMKATDLLIVDMCGRKLKGRREVTSEIGMHLLIYRMRPDVNGIVHAHPKTATGFAAAGMALDKPLACEVVIGLGQIPLAPYGTPGTPELARTLEPLVPQYDAILMANHGVVTYGSDLQSAYMKMETVEHFAQIALVTHILGRQQLLDGDELDKLIAARNKYLGVNSAAPMPVHSSNGNGNGDRHGSKSRTRSLRDRAILRQSGIASLLEN
jgi:L-fuculose-phosphate aldolase